MAKQIAARHVPQQARIEMEGQIARMERIEADEMADKLQLHEWGKWARRRGDTLGFPMCLLPFSAKGSWEKDLRRYVVDISDEEGLRIEAAISALPGMHKAVVYGVYYLLIEHRRLPEVLQVSERQVSAYRNQAIGILFEKLKPAC